MIFVKQILISAIIIISLDFIYLFSLRSIFEHQILKIQGSSLSLNLFPVLLCYILLVGGLYYFILREHKSWKEAGLLGLVIYGVYDTTTMALLKDWSWKIAVLDTVWGSLLFSLTTFLTYKAETYGFRTFPLCYLK
jgi:uncharacterized membrane protein